MDDNKPAIALILVEILIDRTFVIVVIIGEWLRGIRRWERAEELDLVCRALKLKNPIVSYQKQLILECLWHISLKKFLTIF